MSRVIVNAPTISAPAPVPAPAPGSAEIVPETASSCPSLRRRTVSTLLPRLVMTVL
ncbi:MAG: hypothetical protein ABSG43_09920 [Solirubrobacteraceae bacterium]